MWPLARRILNTDDDPERNRGRENQAMKALSRLGFLLMVAGIVGLLFTQSLLSENPVVIAIQVAAFALMIWARITFGRRSFHLAANPTEGRLVTSGPYALVRHPIYAAVCTFVVAGAAGNLPKATCGLALLVFIGVAIRIVLEERLLMQKYPEYAEYAKATKRIVPFVL
jgi:protein-S-isoprenylcysteine O-methyltransferase Ste14